jgi:hypothetical protein
VAGRGKGVALDRARDHAETAGARDERTVSDDGGYRYDVMLWRPRGRLGRWQGRVVTTSPAGERHYWPSTSARRQDQLLAVLWQQAMFDIQWRTGGGRVHVMEVDS